MPQNVSVKLEQAAAELDSTERGGGTRLPFEAFAVHTGSKPLSMYSAPTWAMCFPHVFPYGDGVFGFPRAKALTFQQCEFMHLLREELEYDVLPEMLEAARELFAGGALSREGSLNACSCVPCARACQPFTAPKQSRWGRGRKLGCSSFDYWRRMEQIRLARAHVQRSGYQRKLEMICNASAEKVEAAMCCVGENGLVRDVMLSADCDPEPKEALAELMVCTTDVVGTDGARAKLRHEQNGFALAFGAAGGFFTPNINDVRNPLIVVLHGGGSEERYEVNILDECPDMPSARAMLQIIAEDPVAQARFFVFSIRLFCEHVLGAGPVDELLRHNGRFEGPIFADGIAASGYGGAFGIIAAHHGPIEEQARLSIHPQI